MLEQIDRAVNETDGDEPVRISCLASGPAREVEDFLRNYNGERHIQWTLIDQDARALSYANEKLLRAAAGKERRIQVNCLFTSFRQLAGQDLIYSAGFFDYLPDKAARQIAALCVDMLRPGGRLLLGNAANERDVHWMPEFVLDWHMHYRDISELREVFPNDVVGVHPLTDTSNSWHFIEARRATLAGAKVWGT